MDFIFWENIVSPHKAPFLRSLVDSGHGTVVVATESLTSDRIALGWKVPDLGRARVVIGPNVNEMRKLIANNSKETIHVIAGVRCTELGRQVAQWCVASGRRLGILTEAPDPRGLLGCGRRAKYIMERYTRGRHYDFVLAMGEMGVKWFNRCGYPADKQFPFIYVPEPAPLSLTGGPRGVVSFLYAGQFIQRKGLDILFRAFAALPRNYAQLRLLGDGPEKHRLQTYASNLGIHDEVTWLSKRDAGGVQLEMGKADVTLLPSRHDGWGAVVNESLMAGTPVICSNACGAADLLREPWRGSVFRNGSVKHLASVLKDWVTLGSRSQSQRERIRHWSNQISGDATAKYFAAIMSHIYCKSERPIAPWH